MTFGNGGKKRQKFFGGFDLAGWKAKSRLAARPSAFYFIKDTDQPGLAVTNCWLQIQSRFVSNDLGWLSAKVTGQRRGILNRYPFDKMPPLSFSIPDRNRSAALGRTYLRFEAADRLSRAKLVVIRRKRSRPRPVGGRFGQCQKPRQKCDTGINVAIHSAASRRPASCSMGFSEAAIMSALYLSNPFR